MTITAAALGFMVPAIAVLAVATGLALWAWLPLQVAAWLLTPVWLLCWQLIFVSGLERARLRRRAWLGQYLKPGSVWVRRLRGGVLMVLVQQLTAAILALWLVLSLRLILLADGLLLLAGMIVWLLLVRGLRGCLAPHALPGRVEPLARRLSVGPVAFVLALALVGFAMVRVQPHYGDMALAQALHYGLQGLSGDSLLAVLQRLAVALDVTQHWAIQSLDGAGLPGRMLVMVGWVMVFALNSAFAWSWVRALSGGQVLVSRLNARR